MVPTLVPLVPWYGTISNDIQLYKTKIYDEYLSISNGHRKASKNGN